MSPPIAPPRIHNIGIIGYGLSAKVFHIPLILECSAQFKLHAIVQRCSTPENDAERDHPGIRIYMSAEEMLRDVEVDVVVVTTPPETHFALSKMALEGGRHVIVEKPFTPTSAEADELIAIAKSCRRLLTVYQNRRWDSDFLTLSKLLDTAVLGRIVEFETHFDRYRPQASPTGWKSQVLPGGGVVYDLGSHLIDQVVLRFGLPQRITGFVGSQREGTGSGPKGYEDSCTILLHYGGMLATVKAAVVSLEVEQLRFWVRGEGGSYKKFHLDPQEDQLKAGKKPSDPGFGIEPDERQGTLTTLPLQNNNTTHNPHRSSHPNITPPATYIAFYTQFATALSSRGGGGEREREREGGGAGDWEETGQGKGKGDGEGDGEGQGEGQGERDEGDPSKVPVKAEEARDVIRLIELARESSRVGRTMDVAR